MKYKILLIAACCSSLILSGCTNVAVYERNLLAKTGMAFEPDPMESAIKEHIYFAKEGSSSGSAVSGGGCGCN